MANPVIKTQGLIKKFGSFTALHDLNLQVMPGETHGFLGPNGAGKSTTIRILLGLIQKSGGTAQLFGEDPWSDPTRLHRRLAYVPGDINLWPSLSGGECIDLIASLRGQANDQRRARLLERFELDPTKKSRTYSKGNRQKVAIISALVSDVDLYIFDEPTSGLDPLMQAVFQDEVRELGRSGKTILLSSHVLEEVEDLCDAVTIIREGRTIESGPLSSLRQYQQLSVTLETAKPVTGLDKLPISLTDQNETSLSFKVRSQDLDTALKHLGKFTILSLTSAPPTLEELFMHYYEDDTKEAGQ